MSTDIIETYLMIEKYLDDDPNFKCDLISTTYVFSSYIECAAITDASIVLLSNKYLNTIILKKFKDYLNKPNLNFINYLCLSFYPFLLFLMMKYNHNFYNLDIESYVTMMSVVRTKLLPREYTHPQDTIQNYLRKMYEKENIEDKKEDKPMLKTEHMTKYMMNDSINSEQLNNLVEKLIYFKKNETSDNILFKNNKISDMKGYFWSKRLQIKTINYWLFFTNFLSTCSFRIEEENKCKLENWQKKLNNMEFRRSNEYRENQIEELYESEISYSNINFENLSKIKVKKVNYKQFNQYILKNPLYLKYINFIDIDIDKYEIQKLEYLNEEI